jgi:hypothetical protein
MLEKESALYQHQQFFPTQVPTKSTIMQIVQNKLHSRTFEIRYDGTKMISYKFTQKTIAKLIQ